MDGIPIYRKNIYIRQMANRKYGIRIEPTEEYQEVDKFEDLVAILRTIFDRKEKE